MQYLIFLLVFHSFSAVRPVVPEPIQTPVDGTGIVYFSLDNGLTWQDKSYGLPEDLHLTDLAVADSMLLVSTKQNGIFIYNFRKNAWQHTPNFPPTTSNLDVVNVYQGQILVGSQNDGLFMSADQGKTWSKHNAGLENSSIRSISVFGNTLLLGTNAGLYSWDEKQDKWQLLFGNPTLHINGVAKLDSDLYIGTNQGIFKSKAPFTDWKTVLSGRSLHNLSANDHELYAMVYNELYVSTDKGLTWQSVQAGLPKNLYTFQVR